MLDEAAATPDVEVCGLLIGTNTVERIIPTPNVAEDPTSTFELDPAALFAAIRAERHGEGRLLGYYHSHPIGPPTPSSLDLIHAKNDRRIWMIIGEQRVTAWQMTNTNKFNEITLKITS